MSRSTYIYVVDCYVPAFGGGEYQLLGAFTVKHEMVDAVQRKIDDSMIPVPDYIRIRRCRDGLFTELVDITNEFSWRRNGRES